MNYECGNGSDLGNRLLAVNKKEMHGVKHKIAIT